jgi:transposase
VRVRARLITTLRGLVKPFGYRFARKAAEHFHQLPDELPDELTGSLQPLFDVLVSLNEQIELLDSRIAQALADNAAAKNLTTVSGVGPITALAFTLFIDDPQRFRNSRQVGAFFGLTSRIDQSGESDKQLRITRAGDGMVRRLLVQCAQGMMRTHAQDTSLKRWALGLAERGGRAAKKKAVIALARKLAVILHRMWCDNQPFRAFPEAA